MKYIPFSICAVLVAFLNHQADQHNFPIGLYGSMVVFLLSIGYCLIYLLIVGFRFLKGLQWGRFSLWFLIPIGLVSALFILRESDQKFKYETLFEDSTYCIIGQFLPVSGGKHMYWVLKKKGIGWKCITAPLYGRIKPLPPQVIPTINGDALLRYLQESERYDTLLLKDLRF